MNWRRLLGPERFSTILVAAGVTGVLTGLVVAAFEYLTTEIALEHVLGLPTWQQAFMPAIGLLVATLLLRYLAGNASPATADEFVRVYHDRSARLSLRPLAGRLMAGVATIGSGGALGLEGPAIYAGSTIGDSLQHRLSRFFRREDAKLLLTAGAAAGVAAVFKTPATGVIFALEGPYRDDVARRALLPALIAAASGYLTYVAVIGTEPIFPGLGVRPVLELSGLVGAVIVGLLAGLGGRTFAWFVRRAKEGAARFRVRWRLLVGGVVLGGLVVLSDALFDEALTLGPGYEAVRFAVDPENGLALISVLFVLRMAASITTLGAGGVGGLFIPLTVQGILLGTMVGEVLGQGESSLYPTIGLAAFLGAGYRAPITAVMFVAESTNGDFFVIPALIAAAVSQLVAGPGSVSLYQRVVRRGKLEDRLALPLSNALSSDVMTVPSDATAAEFVWTHVVALRTRIVPVVDGNHYVGLCLLDDVAELDRDEWESTPVSAVARTDLPTAEPGWSLGDAMTAMEEADVDLLAVTDASGSFVGTVEASEILELREILDQTGG